MIKLDTQNDRHFLPVDPVFRVKNWTILPPFPKGTIISGVRIPKPPAPGKDDGKIKKVAGEGPEPVVGKAVYLPWTTRESAPTTCGDCGISFKSGSSAGVHWRLV